MELSVQAGWWVPPMCIFYAAGIYNIAAGALLVLAAMMSFHTQARAYVPRHAPA